MPSVIINNAEIENIRLVSSEAITENTTIQSSRTNLMGNPVRTVNLTDPAL